MKWNVQRIENYAAPHEAELELVILSSQAFQGKRKKNPAFL